MRYLTENIFTKYKMAKPHLSFCLYHHTSIFRAQPVHTQHRKHWLSLFLSLPVIYRSDWIDW